MSFLSVVGDIVAFSHICILSPKALGIDFFFGNDKRMKVIILNDKNSSRQNL
jgi:hypothetical protein